MKMHFKYERILCVKLPPDLGGKKEKIATKVEGLNRSRKFCRG